MARVKENIVTGESSREQQLQLLSDTLEKYEYRQDTGTLHLKHGRGKKKVGDEAGYINENGYRKVCVNGNGYFTHRQIFLIEERYLPDSNMVVDHISGIQLANHISNLRVISQRDNIQNQSQKSRTSNTGFTGVYWIESRNKYRAFITIPAKTGCGKKKSIGYFDTLEAAVAAREAAVDKHYKGATGRTN